MTATARLPHLPALDGLRGVAVLLVVVYHLAPQLLPGGSVGVDVFFVLSGFLITRGLVAQHAAGRSTPWRFYAARIRRLFPALLLVLVFVLLLGWCFQLEHELRATGKHASAAALFMANTSLWRSGSYFAEDSWHEPLRHLWSLAVEEQFYLVWPVVLPCLLKLRGWAPIVLALSIPAGMLAAMHPHDALPTTAFYLMPYRAWEVLVGALLGLRPWSLPVPARTRSVLVLAALACIVLAALVPAPEHTLVLPHVLPAVLGAGVLVGLSAAGATVRPLEARPLVLLGRISYPLYLWHWPLLALARTIWWDTVPTTVLLSIAALSVLLAYCSERWLEEPLRNAARLRSLRGAIVFLVLPMLALLLLATSVERGVLRERLHAVSAVRSEAVHDKAPVVQAILPGTLPGMVVILGDSYVGQFHPRLDSLHRTGMPHRTIRFLGRLGCPPMGLHSTLDPACAQAGEEAFRQASAPDVTTVVIGSSWLGAYLREDLYWPGMPPGDRSWARGLFQLEAHVARLRAAGKEVYLLLTPPGGAWAHPANAPRERWTGRPGDHSNQCTLAAHRARVAAVNEPLAAMAARHDVHLLDLADVLCKDGVCMGVDTQGAPIYTDATHLRGSFMRCCGTVLDAVVGE
jgi:peptidoglycan/LPS O-acetylase OafA/YrhL